MNEALFLFLFLIFWFGAGILAVIIMPKKEFFDVKGTELFRLECILLILLGPFALIHAMDRCLKVKR
jgi:hypothetical protein